MGEEENVVGQLNFQAEQHLPPQEILAWLRRPGAQTVYSRPFYHATPPGYHGVQAYGNKSCGMERSGPHILGGWGGHSEKEPGFSPQEILKGPIGTHKI